MGDKPGHRFHGNQWGEGGKGSGGGGSVSVSKGDYGSEAKIAADKVMVSGELRAEDNPELARQMNDGRAFGAEVASRYQVQHPNDAAAQKKAIMGFAQDQQTLVNEGAGIARAAYEAGDFATATHEAKNAWYNYAAGNNALASVAGWANRSLRPPNLKVDKASTRRSRPRQGKSRDWTEYPPGSSARLRAFKRQHPGE